MKSLNNFIFESNDISSTGKKILSILSKDESDIIKAIIDKNQKWDNNKFDWSHDPMFLISKNNELKWTRKKFFDTTLVNVTGTFADQNSVANENGEYPVNVLGVYFDRQFYPITSLDTFNKIKELLEQ